MNSQELETAVRHEIAMVSLIFHDNTYSLIELKQLRTFGRKSNVNFSNPDFVKYAESFGAVGYRVHAADELKPILEEAFSAERPVVIDCPVDYSETVNLMDRLGKLICPI